MVVIDVINLFVLWVPTVDNGCCFGHHFGQQSSNSLKTQVAVRAPQGARAYP